MRPATETGSVIASVRPFRALAGPTTATVDRFDRDAADGIARGGLAFDPNRDADRLRERLFERQRHARRRDLHDFDAERRSHIFRPSDETADRPILAVRTSSTADNSPAATRLSVPDEPRTRTSTTAGGEPTSSS